MNSRYAGKLVSEEKVFSHMHHPHRASKRKKSLKLYLVLALACALAAVISQAFTGMNTDEREASNEIGVDDGRR